MRGFFWLLRKTVWRRSTFGRVLALVAACTLTTLTVLFCVSAGQVVERQSEKLASIAPVFSNNQAGASSNLLMARSDDALLDEAVTRYVVEAQSDAPLAPGVAAWPAAGEMVLSPALAELVRDDPGVSDRYPWSLQSVIGRDGLASPDDLVAYVGASSVNEAYEVTGFGVAGYSDAIPDSISIAPVLFAIAVLFPLTALIVACINLHAADRRSRMARLRLLGVPQSSIIAAIVGEIALVSAAGVLLAIGLFETLQRIKDGWSIGRFSWFTVDAQLRWPVIAVTGLCVVAYTILMTFGATRGLRKPLAVMRRLGAKSSKRRASAVVLSGVALLALSLFISAPLVAAALSAVGAVVLLGGASMAMSAVVRWWGPRQPWKGSTVWTLAWKRASAPGVALGRRSRPLLATFAAAAVALAFASALVPRLEDPIRQQQTITISGAERDPDTVAALRDVDGVQRVSDLWFSYQLEAGVPVSVAGDCQSLAQAWTLEFTCVPGRAYSLTGDAINVADIQTPEGKSPDSVVVGAVASYGPASSYALPSNLVALYPGQETPLSAWAGKFEHRIDVQFSGTEATRSAVLKVLGTDLLGAQVSGTLGIQRGLTPGVVRTLLQVAVGCFALLLFAVAALSCIQTVQTRRVSDVGARAMGVPRSLLRRAATAEAVLELILYTAVLSPLILLCSVVIAVNGGRSIADVTSNFPALLLAMLCLTAVLGLCTYMFYPRNFALQDLRQD